MRANIIFAILVALGVASWTHANAGEVATDRVQGAITVAPDEKGTFLLQPQGTQGPTDVVKVATDAKTVVSVAQNRIKVADLQAGMWARAVLADGVATEIIAGHLWLEEGEKLVFFKGLPQEFFTHAAGFDVSNVATKFGPLRMVYRLAGNGSYLRWGRKALPKEGMVVCWPATLKARFSYGPPVKPDDQGMLHLPADVSELRIWFVDSVVPTKDGSEAHDTGKGASATQPADSPKPVEEKKPVQQPNYTLYHITSIGSGTLVVHSCLTPTQFTVTTDEKTVVLLPDDKVGKRSDLQVGQWVKLHRKGDRNDPEHQQIARIELIVAPWAAQRLADLEKNVGAVEISLMVFIGQIEQDGSVIRQTGPGSLEELHLIGPDHAGGYKEPFQARLQKDEMARLLHHMALEGFLADAQDSNRKDVEPSKPPATPYLKLSVGQFVTYYSWGPDTIKRLERLKVVVGQKAGQKIDGLLAKVREQVTALQKPEAKDEKAGLQRREVFFSGHVQGVGFRQTTVTLAKQFAVTGFVKNLPDGRVQLVVEGQPKEIEALLAAIREKMSKNIKNAEENTSPATGEFQGFEIGF